MRSLHHGLPRAQTLTLRPRSSLSGFAQDQHPGSRRGARAFPPATGGSAPWRESLSAYASGAHGHQRPQPEPPGRRGGLQRLQTEVDDEGHRRARKARPSCAAPRRSSASAARGRRSTSWKCFFRPAARSRKSASHLHVLTVPAPARPLRSRKPELGDQGVRDPLAEPLREPARIRAAPPARACASRSPRPPSAARAAGRRGSRSTSGRFAWRAPRRPRRVAGATRVFRACASAASAWSRTRWRAAKERWREPGIGVEQAWAGLPAGCSRAGA